MDIVMLIGISCLVIGTMIFFASFIYHESVGTRIVASAVLGVGAILFVTPGFPSLESLIIMAMGVGLVVVPTLIRLRLKRRSAQQS